MNNKISTKIVDIFIWFWLKENTNNYIIKEGRWGVFYDKSSN